MTSTSTGWNINHYNLSHHDRQFLGKLRSPSSSSNAKALPENSHRPLTSSMLDMPRSLMSTSGWFFSRLSSTNFFRDLDMICTKRQQHSTWAKAGECGDRNESTLSGTLGFPLALEREHQRAASGCRGRVGAGQGSGKGPAPLRPPGGIKVECNATHTHCGGQHLTGWAWKRQASPRFTSRVKDALRRS